MFVCIFYALFSGINAATFLVLIWLFYSSTSEVNTHHLLASSKWSADWELILNPSKCEHLPVEGTSSSVTYSLTSRTSPNAQLIQTISSVRDLRLLLNTGFHVNDKVGRATKKTWSSCLPKAVLRSPDPYIFLPFIRPHLGYVIQASSPLLSRDCQALESVQKNPGEICKGVAPRPIRNSPPAAAGIFSRQ